MSIISEQTAVLINMCCTNVTFSFYFGMKKNNLQKIINKMTDVEE